MAQSKELKNLLRRVRRFNLANPTNALNVESIAKAGNSPSRIERASVRLVKAQQLAKAQRAIQSTATQIKEIQHKGHVYESASKNLIKPVRYKVPRTLTAAQKELARIKAEKAKANAFRKAQDKFVRQAAEYNRKLGLSNNKNRYIFIPRNEKELAQHKKALDAIKRGKVEEAKKILKIPQTKQVRDVLMKRDSANVKRYGGFSYNDRLFLYQAVINARSSPVPELAELFRAGGESLILELERGGFTMIEYYDPDLTVDEIENHILDMLEEVAEQMNGRNKQLTEQFINRVRPKYQ